MLFDPPLEFRILAQRTADPHSHLGARLLPGRAEVALDLVDAPRPGAGGGRTTPIDEAQR